jgi:trigger factor
VNVTVENLGPCKKLMRVEVDAQAVDEAFKKALLEYQKQAQLPGFRPGKAPLDMVARRYEKDIQDDVRHRLISETYRDAVDQQKLDVVGAPDIEEIQFAKGQALQFAATIETAPEFEIPEYQGIPVKKEARGVTDEDVERAMEALRQPRATFNTVQRAAATGDIAVVNYTGTCEGKPINEIVPTARGLTSQKEFWVEIGSDNFIPGFSAQLIGATAGEKRTVTVQFPPDFVTKELSGKQGVYDVEVVEVKERVLPTLDDEFAKKYGAENVEKLREGVRHDLQNELNYKQKRAIRNQIIHSLLNRATFELPKSAVDRETRNVVYDIVQENAKRGLSRETIEKESDKIYTAAAQGARERVKLSFLLQRIAEKEDIKVSQEEIGQRIHTMAAMYNIEPKKFVKDLQKRNALIEIYDQIMNEKVLDLLEQQAKIEEVAPGTPAPA